ncbi:hypothetical protein BDM02DRAFT_3181827 [Thelephora ganbajun]|uniref:Uncharacterized protein n=1 Tax=Thelephora ganbajun TaxID=370292 RepID=A0ACB6Z1C4_THEGA|nr:hypothetical protein BDM02DRAFT_3181827 [Thelephora ganbajun]
MYPTADLLAVRKPVVVTDQLQAPADFLVFRTVTTHLKENKQNRCIILSTFNDVPRWKAIASKSALNVDQLIASGSLKFLDILSHVQPGADTLRPLLDLVQTSVSDPSAIIPHFLVVFDGISTLEWLGFNATEVSRLCRALSSLCRKSSASLLFRYHLLDREMIDSTFSLLQQLAAYRVEVRPLSSGKSGAVSGEICIHLGPLHDKSLATIEPDKTFQYRLTDFSATFFTKGTGATVL